MGCVGPFGGVFDLSRLNASGSCGKRRSSDFGGKVHIYYCMMVEYIISKLLNREIVLFYYSIIVLLMQNS
jgi:hypothetical protein